MYIQQGILGYYTMGMSGFDNQHALWSNPNFDPYTWSYGLPR